MSTNSTRRHQAGQMGVLGAGRPLPRLPRLPRGPRDDRGGPADGAGRAARVSLGRPGGGLPDHVPAVRQARPGLGLHVIGNLGVLSDYHIYNISMYNKARMKL